VQFVAQGAPAEWLAGGGERGDDGLLEVGGAAGALGAGLDESEVGVAAALVGDEAQVEGSGAWAARCSTVRVRLPC
jgi:hypothetical protein